MFTEQELIIQLCKKNEAAFRQLVERFRNPVYNTVLNMLQDTGEAEDAAQEVFIKVYESISRFRQDASLSTWIYRIAVRKALDKLRRRKTRQQLHRLLPWWMPEEKKEGKAVFNHPGVQSENREKAALLFRAIDSLPERQKLAFTLIRVQGMPYEEAAAIMELNIKAIESLVSRAKQGLQQKLQQLKP